MSIQRFLKAAALGVLVLPAASLSAQAEDLGGTNSYGYATPRPRPAVDGVNGAIGVLGGTSDDGEVYGATGRLTLPVAPNYGAQADGTLLNSDGSAYLALGGHAFWRDPSKGLVGGYTSYSHNYEAGTVDTGRVGVEGEAYVGQLTVRGVAGVEFADGERQVKDGVETSFEEGARFFDQAQLAYYPTDNVEVHVGHSYTSGTHALGLGGEMQLQSGRSTAVSTFVEGRLGEGGHQAAWAGLKLKFGSSPKSLVQGDREDGAPSWEPDAFYGIVNARKENRVAVAP